MCKHNLAHRHVHHRQCCSARTSNEISLPMIVLAMTNAVVSNFQTSSRSKSTSEMFHATSCLHFAKPTVLFAFQPDWSLICLCILLLSQLFSSSLLEQQRSLSNLRARNSVAEAGRVLEGRPGTETARLRLLGRIVKELEIFSKTSPWFPPCAGCGWWSAIRGG